MFIALKHLEVAIATSTLRIVQLLLEKAFMVPFMKKARLIRTSACEIEGVY